MITMLAMGWNHRKVDRLHKTLAKRFVKVRSLYCMLTFTVVTSWLLLEVLNTDIRHMLVNEKYSANITFFYSRWILA